MLDSFPTDHEWRAVGDVERYALGPPDGPGIRFEDGRHAEVVVWVKSLIAAAAARWSVDPASCVATNGEVVHPPTSGKLSFGASRIYFRLPKPNPRDY